MEAAESGRLQARDVPLLDPSPRLDPTAMRVLDAARAVLVSDGYSALTLKRIAAEAGVTPATIKRHFGTKEGLSAALFDMVVFKEAVDLIDLLGAAEPGEPRREALLGLYERYVRDDMESYALFFDVIAPALHDDVLRLRLQALFEWYRSLNRWALKSCRPPVPQSLMDPLAMLSVALVDGIALQVQGDPELDVGPAFALWREMVVERLAKAAREAPSR